MPLPDGAADAVRSVVDEALVAGAGPLGLEAVEAVCAAVGVERLATAAVSDVDGAVAAATHLGYPVALKAAGRAAMAKTMVAGLALDLPDERALRTAWARMAERFGDAMVPALVQPMVEPGVDVAISVHDHPEVGPVISLRPGGANAALDPAADRQVLPIGDEEARRLVAGSRLAPYLDPGAAAALQELLLRIGALVEEVPEVARVDANPVIVRPDRAVAVEVAIEVAPVEAEPLPPLRRVDP